MSVFNYDDDGGGGDVDGGGDDVNYIEYIFNSVHTCCTVKPCILLIVLIMSALSHSMILGGGRFH